MDTNRDLWRKYFPYAFRFWESWPFCRVTCASELLYRITCFWKRSKEKWCIIRPSMPFRHSIRTALRYVLVKPIPLTTCPPLAIMWLPISHEKTVLGFHTLRSGIWRKGRWYNIASMRRAAYRLPTISVASYTSAYISKIWSIPIERNEYFFIVLFLLDISIKVN